MAIHGNHVALTPEEVELLLAHVDVSISQSEYEAEEDYSDNAVCFLLRDFADERYRTGQLQFVAEVDGSIDVLHRCLTNGTMTASSKYYPFNKVVAGKQLYEEGFLVFFVTRQEVADIAAALANIDPDELKSRYPALKETDYCKYMQEEYMREDEDEWMVVYFLRLREFYQNAAKAERPAAHYIAL